MIFSGLPGSGMFVIMLPLIIYFAAAPERVSGAEAGDIVIEAIRGPWPKHR